MACVFNGNGCANCKHFVKTTKITYCRGYLILEIPPKTYNNSDLLCICLAQDVPDFDGIARVVVQNGDSDYRYPVITTTSFGLAGTPNNLYSDQLLKCKCTGKIKPRQILNLRFGSDTYMLHYVGNRRPLVNTKEKFMEAAPNLKRALYDKAEVKSDENEVKKGKEK